MNQFLHVALDLLGKLGPPTFAATLVACFFSSHLEPIHFTLIGVGVLFTGIGYVADRFQ